MDRIVEPLVEPSGVERAGWGDATRAYVAGLEARSDALRTYADDVWDDDERGFVACAGGPGYARGFFPGVYGECPSCAGAGLYDCGLCSGVGRVLLADVVGGVESNRAVMVASGVPFAWVGVPGERGVPGEEDCVVVHGGRACRFSPATGAWWRCHPDGSAFPVPARVTGASEGAASFLRAWRGYVVRWVQSDLARLHVTQVQEARFLVGLVWQWPLGGEEVVAWREWTAAWLKHGVGAIVHAGTPAREVFPVGDLTNPHYVEEIGRVLLRVAARATDPAWAGNAEGLRRARTMATVRATVAAVPWVDVHGILRWACGGDQSLPSVPERDVPVERGGAEDSVPVERGEEA